MTGLGRGVLRFYSLYSNVYTTASEIQPLLTFNLTINKALGNLKSFGGGIKVEEILIIFLSSAKKKMARASSYLNAVRF